MRNPTEFEVYVGVCYVKGTSWVYVEGSRVTIQPGGEHTFNVPGSDCPWGLDGALVALPVHEIPKIRETSCLGHSASRDAWSPCCWNSTFEVCRKAGDADSFKDNDFGFCKK